MTFPNSFQIGGIGSYNIKRITSNYIIGAYDRRVILQATIVTSITISITSAAILGIGFETTIWNLSTDNSYAVTLDPNGSETIDNYPTFVIRRGEGLTIVSDGTNWQTSNKKPMRAYQENFPTTITRPVANGNSAIAIGDNATASSTNAIAIGWNMNATAQSAVALGGNSSTASGANSFLAGRLNTSSGQYSFTAGNNCSATKLAAIAIGDGANSTTIGKFAYTGNSRATTGLSQTGLYVLTQDTTNATVTTLTTDLAAAGLDNQIVLPNNSVYVFTGTIVARQQSSGGTQSAGWKVEGLIRRGGSTGTMDLVASAINTISNVPGWIIALAIDNTNGGLAVTVTGAAATNIRWVATIQTSEATYA